MSFGAGSRRRSASHPIAFVIDGRIKTSSLFTGGVFVWRGLSRLTDIETGAELEVAALVGN